MKQLLIKSLAVMALFGMTFVSCKDDDTGKHVYTEEELAEMARQDSLRNLIPATYVYSYNITIPISRGYDGATVTIDSTKILELFDYNTVAELSAALGTITNGAQTGNDITFFGYNYSTKAMNTAKGPSNTNYFGHWFNAAGDVVDWGDDGSTLFCEKKDTFSLDFTIGFRPDRPAVDSVYHIIEGMKMGDVTIAFLFNVKVGPEEVIEAEVVGSQTISFSAPQDAGYKSFPQDINTSAITTAIGAAPSLTLLYGINTDNSIYAGGKTASLGYWYNASGNVCNWNAEACAMCLEFDAATGKINVCQFPDGAVSGQTYTATAAFVNGNKQYNIVVNMTVTDPILVYPETTLAGTAEYTLSLDTLNNYEANPVAIDSAAIHAAIGCGPASATLYGVNANDSLYIKAMTGDNGNWFNAAGNVCAWGEATSAMCANYDAVNRVFNVFQKPNNVTKGQTYRCKTAFVNADKRYVVTIVMNIKP